MSKREPYLDEEHLYNKYESMKMANERNMREKFDALNELKAIEMFINGEPYSVSTFIDEVTLTYGYGELHGVGTWQYQLPQWFVNSKVFEMLKIQGRG